MHTEYIDTYIIRFLHETRGFGIMGYRSMGIDTHGISTRDIGIRGIGTRDIGNRVSVYSGYRVFTSIDKQSNSIDCMINSKTITIQLQESLMQIRRRMEPGVPRFGFVCEMASEE